MSARFRWRTGSRSTPRGSICPLPNGFVESTSTTSMECLSFWYWKPSSRMSVSHPSRLIAYRPAFTRSRSTTTATPGRLDASMYGSSPPVVASHSTWRPSETTSGFVTTCVNMRTHHGASLRR